MPRNTRSESIRRKRAHSAPRAAEEHSGVKRPAKRFAQGIAGTPLNMLGKW